MSNEGAKSTEANEDKSRGGSLKESEENAESGFTIKTLYNKTLTYSPTNYGSYDTNVEPTQIVSRTYLNRNLHVKDDKTPTNNSKPLSASSQEILDLIDKEIENEKRESNERQRTRKKSLCCFK